MAKLKIQWVKQYLRTCVLEFCTFLIYPLQNNNVKTPTFARPVNGNLDGKSLKFTLDMLKLRRGAIRDNKYIQPFAKFLLKLCFWTNLNVYLERTLNPLWTGLHQCARWLIRGLVPFYSSTKCRAETIRDSLVLLLWDTIFFPVRLEHWIQIW